MIRTKPKEPYKGLKRTPRKRSTVKKKPRKVSFLTKTPPPLHKPIHKMSKKMAIQKRQEDKLRAECLIRCKGLCERCHQLPDWRGLSLSHTDPKGMGGTNHKYTIDEVQLLCGKCHAELHGIHETSVLFIDEAAKYIDPEAYYNT